MQTLFTIHMYSGITSGLVLDGEVLYTFLFQLYIYLGQERLRLPIQKTYQINIKYI